MIVTLILFAWLELSEIGKVMKPYLNKTSSDSRSAHTKCKSTDDLSGLLDVFTNKGLMVPRIANNTGPGDYEDKVNILRESHNLTCRDLYQLIAKEGDRALMQQTMDHPRSHTDFETQTVIKDMIRKNIERVRSTLSMRVSHLEELEGEDRGKENAGLFGGEQEEEEVEVPAEEPARRVRQMVLNKRKVTPNKKASSLTSV